MGTVKMLGLVGLWALTEGEKNRGEREKKKNSLVIRMNRKRGWPITNNSMTVLVSQ